MSSANKKGKTNDCRHKIFDAEVINICGKFIKILIQKRLCSHKTAPNSNAIIYEKSTTDVSLLYYRNQMECVSMLSHASFSSSFLSFSCAYRIFWYRSLEQPCSWIVENRYVRKFLLLSISVTARISGQRMIFWWSEKLSCWMKRRKFYMRS